ncbi:MAG: hypothetical protein BWY22_01890 [Bacteroidetes bacterium ADurb.Bin217]|nr:MAG: hypothetical protein BWY22_01890 [Bacteroidetes bacterium ADurb.Bin217]
MNKIFKSDYVYVLFLTRSIFVIVLYVIFSIIKFDFLNYILIPIHFILFVMSIRIFYFYEDYILVKFLWKEIIIKYDNVIKIKYEFPINGFPIFYIQLKKTNWNNFINYFYFRFVSINLSENIKLLSFLKNRGIDFDIKTTKDYKNKLLNEI